MSRWVSLGFALIVVTALYAAAWFAAAGEAGRRMDAWQRNEAALGRRWSCPDRRITGFPFAIIVECNDATFAALGNGHQDEAKVAHVSAAVSILHPSRLSVALRSPFSFVTPNNASHDANAVSAHWTALNLDVGPLAGPRSIHVRGAGLSFDARLGSSDRQSGGMATLAAQFDMRDGASDPAVGFVIHVGGTDLAPLDELFGNVQLADLDLTGQIDHADVGAAATPEGLVEAWRLAGGRIELAGSRLGRGTAAVSADGVIGLDDAHRPQGRLRAEFVGVGPVLQRYGIAPGLVAAGSLLSSLFGGGHSRSPAQAGAISLPIDLRGGRLGVGPITTSVELPALY